MMSLLTALLPRRRGPAHGSWTRDTRGHCAAYSLRIVGIAWAFSAWTKASWLLGGSRPPFRGLTDDDKRYFAVYHLCTAYAALSGIRHLQEVKKPFMQRLWAL